MFADSWGLHLPVCHLTPKEMSPISSCVGGRSHLTSQGETQLHSVFNVDDESWRFLDYLMNMTGASGMETYLGKRGLS